MSQEFLKVLISQFEKNSASPTFNLRSASRMRLVKEEEQVQQAAREGRGESSTDILGNSPSKPSWTKKTGLTTEDASSLDGDDDEDDDDGKADLAEE